MSQQPFDEAGPSTSSAAIRQQQQQDSRLGKEDKNCFLLLITGQIETVELISIPNIYCKYCFVYGPDWRQVGGMEEGISATAYKTERSFNNKIVLNTPIEATFSSTNPFKWPQIVLSFYGQDHFGNDVIRGYTSTHLPTTPGNVKRKCPIFLPQATTNIQRIIGLLTGRRAEFVDPTIIAKSEGRDVTRVSTQGFVELSLSAIFRNTKKFGYDLSKQTLIKFSEFPLDIPKINLFEEKKAQFEEIQQKSKRIERVKEKGGPTKITTDIEIIEESPEEEQDEQTK
ncbi:hypothetical protein ACQ4LE_006714 [Meloidogyne hapla]